MIGVHIAWMVLQRSCTSMKARETIKINFSSTSVEEAYVVRIPLIRLYKAAMKGVIPYSVHLKSSHPSLILMILAFFQLRNKETLPFGIGQKCSPSTVMAPSMKATEKIQWSTRERNYISEDLEMPKNNSTTLIRTIISTTQTPLWFQVYPLEPLPLTIGLTLSDKELEKIQKSMECPTVEFSSTITSVPWPERKLSKKDSIISKS